MITLRRDTERRHVKSVKQDVLLTFLPVDGRGPLTGDLGALVAFDEMKLPPGGRTVLHPADDVEIVTYLFRGTLAHEDTTGSSGVIHAGEFQRMTTGRGVRHEQTNTSRTDMAHLYQISLRPSEAGLDTAQEQKRFAAAQRRNVLCVVASQDGRKGSLRTHQDVVIYSSVLDPGHHIIHELLAGRSAWLHVLYGEVTLGDLVLAGGDGVGIAMEPSVSITAQETTEILLVDLGLMAPRVADAAAKKRWKRKLS